MPVKDRLRVSDRIARADPVRLAWSAGALLQSEARTRSRFSRWSASAPPAAPLPADGAPQADPEAVSSGSPFGSQLPISRTGGAEPTQARRVVMDFPAKSDDLLLSGMPNEGRALARKALIVDVPNGRGHMVLYTMRPFWRWQPQGSYSWA